mgnify:CR=1 FL=1
MALRFYVSALLGLICFCLSAQAVKAEEITLNRVVAVVNGDPITLHEVEIQSIPTFAKERLNPNNPADKARVDEVMKTPLDAIIVERLISQEAQRLGVTATDKEVDDEIADIMKRNNLKSQTEFERALSSQGMDLPSFKQKIRSNIISSRLTNQMVSRQILIPHEEVDKYYDEHKDEFIDRDMDLQILVFNRAMKPGDIKAVAAAIKNGKVSFAEAVRKCSVGPASDTDGIVKGMSWMSLSPAIRSVLETATIGKVTDVVDVDGQQMMFILLRLEAPVQKTKDQVSGEIEHKLKAPLAEARFEEYVNQLRNKAVIDNRM